MKKNETTTPSRLDVRDTDSIIAGQNIREEGDITELKNSIAALGILQPLLINEKNELIAGHRRLKAAKELGLKTVPVQIYGIDMEYEAKVSENMHRKNMTGFEEAKVFKDYQDKNRCTIEKLAERFCKTPGYIQRRLDLLKLIPEAVKAFEEKKIEIGHASLLGQMTKEQQKVSLNEILDNDLTVQNFSDQIRWMQKIDFENVMFRPRDNEQRTLIDAIGPELFPKEDNTDSFLGNAAFRKEVAQYAESEREKLRAKGIKVYASTEDLLKEHPNAAEIRSYDNNYVKIVKSLPGSDKYGIVVDLRVNEYGSANFDRDVYRFEPVPEKEKKAAKEEKEKKMSQEELDQASEMLEKSKHDKLQSAVDLYKHQLLGLEIEKRIKPGTKEAKVITKWCLNRFSYETQSIESMYKEEPKELDKSILATAMSHLDDMDTEDREEAIKTLTDFEMKQHWVIDQDFLELHTKDQLVDLAKELKIKLENPNGKKGELIAEILTHDLKGKVPKTMK